MTDLLSIGASGVTAYRTALAAVADNVANADAQGYVRREVVLHERANVGSRSPIYRDDFRFSGVEAHSVRRAWDAFRAADAHFSASASGRADTRAHWLGSVETALGDGPTGVRALLGKFFNSAVLLAATPKDRLGRTAMLMTLEEAAGAIRTTAESLARASDGIGKAANIEAQGLNADLSALAEVNTALSQSAAGRTCRAALEDERDRLIDKIAARIDVSASIGENGIATLTLGRVSGVTLLDPSQRALVVVARASDGRLNLQLSSGGTTTPLPASAGSLAGLVEVAASTADKRAVLDDLAQDFAADLNAWSAQGRDLAGNPGTDLVRLTAGAISLQVIVSDSDRLAAASADGTENGNLLALNGLRGPEGAEAKWAALVAANAQALAAAKSEASAASTRRDNSFAARDEISGVDLDHEAAELIRYQQAYNGSAKVIQVARETMQAILDIF